MALTMHGTNTASGTNSTNTNRTNRKENMRIVSVDQCLAGAPLARFAFFRIQLQPKKPNVG